MGLDGSYPGGNLFRLEFPGKELPGGTFASGTFHRNPFVMAVIGLKYSFDQQKIKL